MRKKFWNFEHLIRSGQRWFPPNFGIFGCLWWILAQSNGPSRSVSLTYHLVCTWYIPLPHTAWRWYQIQHIPSRYVPGTYQVHTMYIHGMRTLYGPRINPESNFIRDHDQDRNRDQNGEIWDGGSRISNRDYRKNTLAEVRVRVPLWPMAHP